MKNMEAPKAHIVPGTILGEKNEGINRKVDAEDGGRLDEVCAIDIVNPLSS